MPRLSPMLIRICLLAIVALQAGCVTVNIIEPSGPVKETQLSGTGDDVLFVFVHAKVDPGLSSHR